MRCLLPIFIFLFTLVFGSHTQAAEPIPVDSSFWKSSQFRRIFTGSYGVDARIEPRIGSDEESVLDSVASSMEDGNRSTAISTLKNSSLTTSSAPLSFSLGNLQFEAGENEEAVEAFENAIQLYPNFRDAHRNLAVALVQEQKFDEAEEPLTRAIELGAQDGLSFGLLGYVHLNHERYQAALQAYRLAQITMPRETQWKLGEAQCLLALGSVQEAVALYRELLEQRPTDLTIWLNQADAFLQLNEPIEAIASLEMTRRMNQLQPQELVLLGHLYLNEGLSAQALDTYQAAVKHEDPVDLVKAVDGLENLCRFEHWEHAKTLIATIQETYDLLQKAKGRDALERSQALVELKAGDEAKGVTLVQRILDRDPLDGQALLLMAKYNESKDEREEAIMLAEQAARDEDTRFDALLFHGQLLVDQHEFAEAVEILEAALALRPSDGLQTYLENVEQLASIQP